MYLLQENKLILVSPGFLLLAHKTRVIHSPPSWHFSTGLVPACLCSASMPSKTGNASVTAFPAEHSHQGPRTLISPHCMYATNLKISNISNSFGALQVSRQQTPVPRRLLCLLEHWHLSTVQSACCTMPELPAQAKLICSSVLLSEEFFLHRYSSLFLREFARILKEFLQWYCYLSLWPALDQEKRAVSCTFTWRPRSLCTQWSP